MKLLGEELNLTSITSCWVIHVWPEIPRGFLGRTLWNHSQIDPHFESVSKRKLLEVNLLAEEFSGDTESKWMYGSQVHISFLGFGMKLQCGFIRTSERNILLTEKVRWSGGHRNRGEILVVNTRGHLSDSGFGEKKGSFTSNESREDRWDVKQIGDQWEGQIRPVLKHGPRSLTCMRIEEN